MIALVKKKKPYHPEFDFDAARKARDEAIKRVDENAEPEWKTLTRLVVTELARTMVPFTTDHVWQKLVEQGAELPHEPRAMGGIMMGLAKAGVIKRIEGQQKSVMVDCHHRPKQLWVGV